MIFSSPLIAFFPDVKLVNGQLVHRLKLQTLSSEYQVSVFHKLNELQFLWVWLL